MSPTPVHQPPSSSDHQWFSTLFHHHRNGTRIDRFLAALPQAPHLADINQVRTELNDLGIFMAGRGKDIITATFEEIVRYLDTRDTGCLLPDDMGRRPVGGGIAGVYVGMSSRLQNWFSLLENCRV